MKAKDKVKLIRVYVQKMDKDLDHQFDIPEDDESCSDVEKLVDADTYDALTTTDIILNPKAYHTENCSIKMMKSYNFTPFGVLERTKASSMNIGMRKMILVPRVVNFINILDENSATIQVTMYNASKQTLRITKKTKIASVRIQKPNILSDEEFNLSIDQREKYGELDCNNTLKEGQLIFLSFDENDVRKPNIVKMISRNGKLLVPLRSEHSGKNKSL